MTHHPDASRDHAVVIGGSLAGLFAARVLSDHYAHVTLLERDPVHDRPESRKGQPQTRHLHALLAQGLHSITHLFPGIDQALTGGGAVLADMGEAMHWYHFGGYRTRFTSGLVGMMMSRPFLEWHVRRRVRALPNVTLRAEHAARALATDASRAAVLGVEVADRRNGNTLRTLRADLVVDATGRGSATPRWLAALGYPPPPESEVTVRVGYATRFYRRRPEALPENEMMLIFSTPPAGKHLTALLPVEGGRWIVTNGGWCGDYPPGDEAGFLDFIRRMPRPDVYEILRQAEPLSEIVTHRFPSNLRRHYEKLNRFPARYLVLGDALASFNPIYGQGMTSAVLQAQALGAVLAAPQRGAQPLWRAFFRRAAQVVEIPWQLAVGEDFRYPETEGPKPPFTDLLNRYVARVHRATHHDPVVYAQFLRTMNLKTPPRSLLHPRIAWRVFRPRARTDERAAS
ncbi:MAG: FAD-dependent monooxygenase [Rhodothermales bacterium]|nr:FAD-dependent monooxygenase [Rhodothermales bacterium]